MRALVRQNYRHIAKGTILRKDNFGDYFISQPDADIVDSPIESGKITVNGHFVESNPEYFELIEVEESAEKLLNEAIMLLRGLDDDVADKAIDKICLAMTSRVE